MALITKIKAYREQAGIKQILIFLKKGDFYFEKKKYDLFFYIFSDEFY